MIVVYGEVLIDMIETKSSFNYFVGGAPFNVAYNINKLNQDVRFVGNVGDDLLGDFIKQFMVENNLNTCGLSIDSNHNTTIAFVKNDTIGERSFCFYRKNTADVYIQEQSLELIEQASIVHLGSLMLSSEYGKHMALSIIKKAKENNKLISFDVNYRDDIFKDQLTAIQTYKEIYEKCDIVKFSLDELLMFANKTDIKEALESLELENIVVYVTLGSKGSLVYFNNKILEVGSIKVDVVDTTGAGDAFFATVLALTNFYGLKTLLGDEKLLKKVLYMANIMGAFATTKKGAISSILTLDELINYIRE